MQVAAGQLGGPPVPGDQMFQFTVNTLGRLSDVAEFENIIVKSMPAIEPDVSRAVEADQTPAAPRSCACRDVAKVELEPAGVLGVLRAQRQEGGAHRGLRAARRQRARRRASATRALMAEIEQVLPRRASSTRRSTTRRCSSTSRSTRSTRRWSIAGVLVLIVIMLFLQNMRAMLVPATTVPVTIIGAFAAMALLGFTVNLMTLFALILAIGIVVDDAIVIVENASHHIEQRPDAEGRGDQGDAGADRPGASASRWCCRRCSCRHPSCPASPGRCSASSRW